MSTQESPETWAPVSGYEGAYEVSSFGRVKSLPRRDKAGQNRKQVILKAALDHCGYFYVALRKDGKTKTHKVHRLVAIAFISGRSLIRNQVNHLDLNRTNNHVSNLEWVSPGENVRHSVKYGAGGCPPKLKISLATVEAVLNDIKAGALTQRAIAVKHNLSHGTVKNIFYGTHYTIANDPEIQKKYGLPLRRCPARARHFKGQVS